MTVDLGFVEKCESWQLESRFFPSKVGGKPAWLDLKNIPGKSDLECGFCGNPCIFLCQVYAPYEDDECAFHRTIYIFICKNADCCRVNESRNLKVFRSQLPRINDYFPSEPPVEREDWRTDIGVKQWVKTCNVCGILAPSHCSKCKITNYCSRVHQIHDWKHGHKETCGCVTQMRSSNLLFPEYEIVIEAEDILKVDNNIHNELANEEKELRKYESMKKMGTAGIFQNEDFDLLKMTNSEEDETFLEFRLRTEKYPDQILRYSRGGNILNISSNNKIEEIPRCSECNTERQFEFQIMPQLLNFLELQNSFECIDWGILAVFTCKKSCTPKVGYIAEYIWKQDITGNKMDSDKK